MWDTFRPLRLAALWEELDKPDYAYSAGIRTGSAPRRASERRQ